MIVHDRLWRLSGPISHPQIIAVTTNSIRKHDGGLVMGRGSAGEAVQRIGATIRFECAQAIRNHHPTFHLDGRPGETYGFLVIREPIADQRVGFAIIQAKYHWRDVAPMTLIETTLDSLYAYACAHPDIRIRTPIPGIGCGLIGRGAPPDVRTIVQMCQRFPDNVIFTHRTHDVPIDI
jgi:hypothetical protein